MVKILFLEKGAEGNLLLNSHSIRPFHDHYPLLTGSRLREPSPLLAFEKIVLILTGLAQSVECCTKKREIVGSIPKAEQTSGSEVNSRRSDATRRSDDLVEMVILSLIVYVMSLII